MRDAGGGAVRLCGFAETRHLRAKPGKHYWRHPACLSTFLSELLQHEREGENLVIRIAFPMIVAVALAGCTAAHASAYDSNNPVHCMTIFGVASHAVRTGPIADDMNARILFIVQSNGGATWLEDMTPVSQRLGAQWEALVDTDGDAIMNLLDTCRAKQDADPEFRRSRASLLREGRQISAGAR